MERLNLKEKYMFNKKFGFSVFLLSIIFYSSNIVPTYALENCPSNVINPDILAHCEMTYDSTTRKIVAHSTVQSGSGSPASGLYFNFYGPGYSNSAILGFGLDYSTTLPADFCGSLGCTLHYRYSHNEVCTIYATGHEGPIETSCSDVCYREGTFVPGDPSTCKYTNNKMCKRNNWLEGCFSDNGCIWGFVAPTNQSLPSWGDTIDIPCPTNTPTPTMTPTRTPTVTATPTIPLPTVTPTIRPSIKPTVSIEPSSTVSPSPTGPTSTPTRIPTITPTAVPTTTPTITMTPTPTVDLPTPTPILPVSCNCYDMDYTGNLSPGEVVTFIAKAKVADAEHNNTEVDNVVFHVERNGVEIARSGNVSTSKPPTREGSDDIYTASWIYRIPFEGFNSVNYKVYIDINCQVKVAQLSNFRTVVLGVSDEKPSLWESIVSYVNKLIGRSSAPKPTVVPTVVMKEDFMQPLSLPGVTTTAPTASPRTLQLATFNNSDVEVSKLCREITFTIRFVWQ